MGDKNLGVCNLVVLKSRRFNCVENRDPDSRFIGTSGPQIIEPLQFR